MWWQFILWLNNCIWVLCGTKVTVDYKYNKHIYFNIMHTTFNNTIYHNCAVFVSHD